MKTLNFALGAAALTLTTGMTGAQAAGSSPTLQQMQACFNAHSQLMERPAVRTLQDCWNAHHYLMNDQKSS